MRRSAAAIALLAVLGSAGCPPPPDVSRVPNTRPAAAPVAATAPTPVWTTDAEHTAPAPQPDAPATPSSAAPAAPAVSPLPQRTVHEHLAGGVFVARCTACGAVQPPSSTKCPSCGQELVPWKQEQVCNVCVGSGQCDRCGDDRVCLDCDGRGACALCNGSGKLGAERCFECGGSGRCVACQGDGRRESVNHDFGPYETHLPGVCPTCIDGSGLCPDCGTVAKDRAGGTCLTCGGTGVCFDCGGSGLCRHDAGDGLCLVCGGGGTEVVDGEPSKLSDRVWTLRTDGGTPFVGQVVERPSPNVHVREQTAKSTVNAYSRGKLNPLTYYLAVRDWTPPADGKALLDLATVAYSCEFWPVAKRDYDRARAADPTVAAEATSQIREVANRRILAWLSAAEKAMKEGNRDGASVLLSMVRFEALGTPQEMRAKVFQLQIQHDADEEAKGLDDAARSKAAAEAKARAERAAAAARLRLERARRLLGEAQQAPAGDPRMERLLARADEAAYTAQRVVQREAYRDPASLTPWTVKPESLVREGRLVRAEIAAFHAAREIAGGRFEFGLRLAQRAVSLDPAGTKAPQLVAEAELGVARLGVLHGSPAPKNR
jgi:hypothetical protein